MRAVEFSDYVSGLRQRNRLALSAIAKYVHDRYPVRAESTLGSWLVPMEAGGAHFHRAVLGTEPERTVLLLYLEALEPAQEERGRIETLIRKHNPIFDFSLLADVKPPELTYGGKLRALPSDERERIQGLIDEAYDSFVVKKD